MVKPIVPIVPSPYQHHFSVVRGTEHDARTLARDIQDYLERRIGFYCDIDKSELQTEDGGLFRVTVYLSQTEVPVSRKSASS